MNSQLVSELQVLEVNNTNVITVMSFPPLANRTLLREIKEANEQFYSGVVIGVLSSEPPRFTRKISNVTAIVERDASMTCYVENAEDYMIAWIRVDTQTILTMDELLISRNHRYSVLRSQNGREWTLTVKAVKHTDEGFYMCQINSDPMMSQMGYLEVLVPPRFDDSETSEDIDVAEGESAALTCKAGGNPMPDITWSREDKKQIHGNKETPALRVAGGRLSFLRTSRADAGAYLCIASNNVPPVVSRRIRLNVMYSPSAHVRVHVDHVSVGEHVRINCTVTGYPRPTVVWKAMENTVKSDNVSHVVKTYFGDDATFSTLDAVFSSSMKGSRVVYQCIGNNSQGVAKDTVTIQVIERIRTTPKPFRQTGASKSDTNDIRMLDYISETQDSQYYHHQQRPEEQVDLSRGNNLGSATFTQTKDSSAGDKEKHFWSISASRTMGPTAIFVAIVFALAILMG